ncbi:MAG: Flp pilus assembly complex ATPase component TadA [Armatimonadetes bacterium]|nr:Flp pilus assembly complex ATPase component TadA [Armatimonadota bacterium]
MQGFYRKRLGDILVSAGLVTEEQLDWALEEQRQSYRRLGEILIEAGWVTEDDIAEARALQLDIAHIQLGDYPIDPQVIKSVPESIARAYKLVPVSASADKVAVALTNPLDVEAVDAVQRVTRKRVESLLASESRINATLDKVYGTLGGADIMASLQEAVSDTDITVPVREEEQQDVDEARRQSGQAPVVRTVNLMLQEAVKRRASDIHIEPRQNNVEVRYRIDGALHHIRNMPKALQAPIISRIKVMADLDIAERRIPQDGRVSIKVANRLIDLRVSTLPIQYGERVVLRILDKSSQHYDLDQLGFTPDDKSAFENLISKPYGIILVTGPTGSGKTTTLYTTLMTLKSPDVNIMTCEDPIEYELEGVNQSAVNVKAGLTFASQLRAILRQDPDIVLVGEIRDTETADIAFRAAMTGHLVLSTLHCNDAASAMTRLVDMGVEPFLIGSSVIGVVAQRLVRIICPRCKSPYDAMIEELAEFGLADMDGSVELHRGEGCNNCDGTGYQGRVGVFEVMTVTEEMRRIILAKPSSDQIEQLGISAGMKTMKQNSADKLLKGITTTAEVSKRIYVGDEVD